MLTSERLGRWGESPSHVSGDLTCSRRPRRPHDLSPSVAATIGSAMTRVALRVRRRAAYATRPPAPQSMRGFFMRFESHHACDGESPSSPRSCTHRCSPFASTTVPTDHVLNTRRHLSPSCRLFTPRRRRAGLEPRDRPAPVDARACPAPFSDRIRAALNDVAVPPTERLRDVDAFRSLR